VYNPPAEIIPALALPPWTPSTFQVTAGLVLLATAAVNCCVWIVEIEAAGGVTVTSIEGGRGEFGELAPPPEQPAKRVKAGTSTAKNILMPGIGSLVISRCAPMMSSYAIGR
jgi:hypothetical protein